ncbi:uncharacterized protein MKK02DRAFT_42478 [Dioszegia hungarica]|uniref:Uncharacterized protein n=1 Tax=Dioszegia hungarica TaxID=4972 RepID=A0AA38HD01_9TREE|nr:uncharacterized protein MKK02DRAFT_42478 [Dioszegia hungarica]KAI9638091.1 hypothetical protein MKK02DRAFT_42478 [Dioszegia hungarica]
MPSYSAILLSVLVPALTMAAPHQPQERAGGAIGDVFAGAPISNIVVKADNVAQCQTAYISWTGANDPVSLFIALGGLYVGETPVTTLSEISGGSTTWLVNQPAGKTLEFRVTDAKGSVAYIQNIKVGAGDSWCLGGTAAGSSSAGGSASPSSSAWVSPFPAAWSESPSPSAVWSEAEQNTAAATTDSPAPRVAAATSSTTPSFSSTTARTTSTSRSSISTSASTFTSMTVPTSSTSTTPSATLAGAGAAASASRTGGASRVNLAGSGAAAVLAAGAMILGLAI